MAKSKPRAKAMAAAALGAALERGAPSVVVLAGSEAWFREDGLRRIVAHVLPDGDPGGALQRLDTRRPEDREEISAAVDHVKSANLFGGRKVIAIDHAESVSGRWAGEKGRRPIVALALEAAGAAGGVLVLLSARSVKGKDGVPLAALQATGAWVVDCRALYDAPGPWERGVPEHDHELSRFVARRMREEHGKAMSLPDAHALTRRVGSDLGGLMDAMRALALYVGARDAVGAEDLDRVTGATRTDPAWLLVDAVFEGETAKALDLLAQALRRGVPDARGAAGIRGPEAVFAYVSAALHGQYRKVLAGAEGLAAGEDGAALARSLGVPSFKTASFLALCRRDPAPLLARHRAFFVAEHGVKSGRMPAALAIERLVVALARAPRSVPRRA